MLNSSPYKILFVCAGNICRSPTAEGIMRKLVLDAKLDSAIYIDSAGISSYHSGDAPDTRSVACAAKYGVDLQSLRSRPVLAQDFAEFDLILAMDARNLADLQYRRPEGDSLYEKAEVKLLLEYAPEYGKEVPDPYYHDGFDSVFNMIEKACHNLLAAISK